MALFSHQPQQLQLQLQQQQQQPASASASLAMPLSDRELLFIAESLLDAPSNPRFRFRHLFLSVCHPSARLRPEGVPEALWQDAMLRLEGMAGADRERLWPEMVSGFDGLANRAKLQDEAIASDLQRLRCLEASLCSLQRHWMAVAASRRQAAKQKQNQLQRRLLRLMHLMESLRSRSLHSPLSPSELQLMDQIRRMLLLLHGPATSASSSGGGQQVGGGEVARRVQSVAWAAEMREGDEKMARGMGREAVDESSMEEVRRILAAQGDAIGRLAEAVREDSRNVGIILSEGALSGHQRQFSWPALGRS